MPTPHSDDHDEPATGNPADRGHRFRRRLRNTWRGEVLWRVVVVVAAVILGGIVDRFPAAQEQVYVLKFMALVAASVFSATWPIIAAVEIALGLAWLVMVHRGNSGWLARLTVDANRTLGHAEALIPWLVLALLLDGPTWVRFGMGAAVVAWGPRALDRVVMLWGRRTGRGELESSQVQRYRRLPMYVATLLATGIILSLAPGQARAMLPSAGVVLAGMALRLSATWQATRRNSGLTHRQWSQVIDVALALGAVAIVGYGSWLLCRPNPQLAFAARVSAAECAPEPAEPAKIAVMLVADTQFHELRGQRSAAHLPMVDAVVPVAVRPVALDLLAGVTLDHFAMLFRRYVDSHASTQTSYAFLGDLADIGCTSEIERYPAYFARFEPPGWLGGSGHLAGIAPGNHDNTFVGNFAWHPDWDTACHLDMPAGGSGARLDKRSSDEAIAKLVKQFGSVGVTMPREPVRGFAAWVEGRTTLPMVSKLGVLPGAVPRPVYAVFVDTGDSALWQYGVAGSQGHVSSAQIDFVRDAVPAQALVILMMHHPLDQLGIFSRLRLAELAESWGPRLLLVVSAHTHRSAWHPHAALGSVEMGEFTVGSTTDPTQEVGMLEIRGSAEAPRLHLATVPAVQRPGMDCVQWSDLDSATCDHELADLAVNCPKLLEDDWRVSLHTPAEMTEHQRDLAQAMFACLGVTTPGQPLDAEVYTAWAARDEAIRRRFVCLSWAASILQRHKVDAWRYTDAVRCAGEKSATLGGFAVDVVRTL